MNTVLGLSKAEVEERLADGRRNILPPSAGKTTWDIIRTNVFTRINAILGVLFVVVLTTGHWIQATFGGLIVVNSVVGIIQELRARKTLSELSILGEEHPQAWRDGKLVEVKQSDIVLDDVLHIGAGAQIVVDGEVRESQYLDVDESMLTGESDPVHKGLGDTVMSGSFVVSGSGDYVVTKVGSDSYAAKLTAEASKYSLAKSQLQAGINQILKIITWVLIPVGILIVISQVRQPGSHNYSDVVLRIAGALVPMVPEGLVLITTTAFALGVIRLGMRQCLVQELPAIEGLARVDVVCADKTGTLTQNTLEFGDFEIVGEIDETTAREGLAQLAASDPDPNVTMKAVADELGTPASLWTVAERQPFTSAKKWSGVSFANGEHWVMGAPDVLAPGTDVEARAIELGDTGLRVLLVGRASVSVTSENAPGDLQPVGLITFVQKIRPDAGDTLDYFARQDVEVKVISGDNARSVGAVTSRLGYDAGVTVDAREIGDDEFTQVVDENRVFGRVRPDQKQAMVKALQSRGHTVAMTGDGVNDVLALKDADIGVAMGSGASATRSVAKIVLLDDKFATLPYVVAEGRRVIGNIERVANLFLTKTIYSAVLAILVVLAQVPYPFMPIHVSITGWFTIGIPAFILSLPPNNSRARDGFVKRTIRFALPAGFIVGVVSFATYLITSGGWDIPEDHIKESTAALLALIIASTWVLACVARPWTWWKVTLIVLPLVGYGVFFFWEPAQWFFSLDSSNMTMMLTGAAFGLLGAALIEGLWWIVARSVGITPVMWKKTPFFDRDEKGRISF
ncbi:HAD-IC family P-type ATPase [Arcanobacterium canis]